MTTKTIITMITREDFFKELNKHAFVLQSTAAKLAKSQEEAHKLYLETIHQSLKNLRSIREHQGFRAWVVTMMKRVFWKETYYLEQA